MLPAYSLMMSIFRVSLSMSIALLDIDKGYALFSKSDYETRKHAHYVIEIIYSTTGTFSVETHHGRYTHLSNAIIPSNLQHRFSSLKATCQLVFLDPLSLPGRYIRQHYQLHLQKDVLCNVPGLERFYNEGVFTVPQVPLEPLDERIQTCLQTIDAQVASHKITLPQLSETSFLSEGRLSHLFKKQLGISVHQYVLWKRMQLAIMKSREGCSLTACAHHVGFTDSSHFIRVFNKMFGIRPFFALKS